MMMAGQHQQQQGPGEPSSSSSRQASAVGAGGAPSQQQQQQSQAEQDKLEEPEHSSSNWYFPREYIERSSPSRKDGIDLKKETYFRKSYCTFLQDLGMRLKVPQVTIATAIVFCHRFFLRQSHLKNDRYTIATTCMFLAGKVEETPQKLCDVIFLSYEIRNKKDPTAIQKIKQKEVYEPQKELVLLAERLVLTTLGFDLNVHHPYKPLVAAIKKFKVAQNALAQVAWNFVNDGLRTSLFLQFKPHHIAAGAIFLAAKFLKVKLPNEGEKVWWQEFEVTPRQLEEVSNQMLELYEHNRDVPVSRSSDPSASASIRNQSRTGGNELPSSSVHAAEEHLTGDNKQATSVASDHQRVTAEVASMPMQAVAESSVKIRKTIEESNTSRVTSNSHAVSDIPQVSEKGSPGEEKTDGGLDSASKIEEVPPTLPLTEVAHQTISDKRGGTVTTAVEAPLEEKVKLDATARLEVMNCSKEKDAPTTTSVVTEMTLSIVTASSQQHQHSPHQDQPKMSWVGLDDVNIDRVKAALKRRKSRGEVGDAKPLTARTELTDEEELLEMDLENGGKKAHSEKNQDNYDNASNHNRGSADVRSHSFSDEEILERDIQNGCGGLLKSQYQHAHKEDNAIQQQHSHVRKFEGDKDLPLHHKDRDWPERDSKRPRLEQGK